MCDAPEFKRAVILEVLHGDFERAKSEAHVAELPHELPHRNPYMLRKRSVYAGSERVLGAPDRNRTCICPLGGGRSIH